MNSKDLPGLFLLCPKGKRIRVSNLLPNDLSPGSPLSLSLFEWVYLTFWHLPASPTAILCVVIITQGD